MCIHLHVYFGDLDVHIHRYIHISMHNHVPTSPRTLGTCVDACIVVDLVKALTTQLSLPAGAIEGSCRLSSDTSLELEILPKRLIYTYMHINI